MKSARSWKIRTKLSALILISAVISIGIFLVLYKQQDKVWQLINKIPSISWDKDEYINELRKAAKDYDVPDTESNEAGQKAIKPFFSTKDEYTGVYVYELGGKGLYRCGAYAEVTDKMIHGSLLDWANRLIENEIEIHTQIPMEFRNGEYMVFIYSYHALILVYPYLIFTLILSIGIFVGINVYFINKRVEDMLCIKDEMLLMSSGHLGNPVPYCGEDEIGVLAEELDKLRMTLKEQIQREADSRKANQDLIAAMSHDLRTPLTILNGYLEVLKLGQTPQIQEAEYLERCIQKVNDIKEMTDKMFEYALVYEEVEEVHMEHIPLEEICGMLQDNIEYLKLAGFCTSLEIEQSSGVIFGDVIMLKRIFSNLFSNILKYGDKQEVVKARLDGQDEHARIWLCNKIKDGTDEIESNGIGLKSVEKMVQIHGGDFHVSKEDGIYMMEIIV